MGRLADQIIWMLWYQSRTHSKEAWDNTINALYNDKWHNSQGSTVVMDSHTPDNIAWKFLRDRCGCGSVGKVLTGQAWWPQFRLATWLWKLAWWCVLETPTGGDKQRYADSGGLLSSQSSKFQVQWETPVSKTKVTNKKGRHAVSTSGLHTHTHARTHKHMCTHARAHKHMHMCTHTQS